jgi:predicted nucleic acid-binding protein
MPAAEPYFDTSALAKRYLDEAGSDDVDAFLGRRPRALISRLVVVELRCLLARRLGARQIDARYEQAALAGRRGHFQVEPLTDRHALTAYDLIDQLLGHSLRTLDALHLAIAQNIGAGILATADLRMARAAEALGFTVVTFGGRRLLRGSRPQGARGRVEHGVDSVARGAESRRLGSTLRAAKPG